MKYISYFSILALIVLSATFIQSMDSKKYSSLKSSGGEFYVEDDSDFHEKKMLSTNSLDALSRLKNQKIIISKEELEQRGYRLIQQKPLWLRCGGALRRYTTTIAVLGTATMVGILTYYLYTAKGEIKKAGNFINQVEPFMDKATKTLDNINEGFKYLCEKFDLPFCSQLKN